MNYYTLLGVDENATEETIKKAFRSKLKAHHPDVHFRKNKTVESQKTSHENLVDIINAYNVLSNPIRKRHYDSHKYKSQLHKGEFDSDIFEPRDKKVFNYEKFLLSRKHIWEYKVKLLIYDLVFCSGERAVGIYELTLKEGKIQELKNTLGYFDYFDSIFLLAEYYQNKIGIIHANKALRLFLEIGEMEHRRPYFKAFMEEVADRVLRLIETYKENLEKETLYKLLNNMADWKVTKKQLRLVSKLRKESNLV